MNRHLRALFAVATLVAVGAAATLTGNPTAHADAVICDPYGTAPIADGRYLVQNNRWGTSTTQCVTVTATGFVLRTSQADLPTDGAPAGYPSVYYGCHYGACSEGTFLPLQTGTKQFGNVSTSVAMTLPGGGAWDAGYDIWFDPTPRTNGQNSGTELMVWLAHAGATQPVGSRVGSVEVAGGTWDVWYGNIGWNVVTYVRTAAATALAFPVSAFYDDAVARGYARRGWYLTSVQAGFEPWSGGVGAAVDAFTVTAAGATSGAGAGAGTTPGASVGGPDPTGSAVGGAGAGGPMGSASPGAPATGRGAGRSPAGRPSATASTGRSTGPSAPGRATGPACSVDYRLNSWGDGFTADIVVHNTGVAAVTGWTLAFTFPGNQRVTAVWNAVVTQSGRSVTAIDVGYNATIAAGGSVEFGFQGSYGGTNEAPTGFVLNGTACTVG